MAAPVGARSAFSGEDPPSEAAGLPAAQENIELVSELNPKGPFGAGGVRVGEIADLTVHKGYAYLNSWDALQCDRGGTYVVDIRDVTAPKEVAYIPPKLVNGQPFFYHGEGAHTISVDTPQFKGDILAVNNETWGSNIPANPCGPASKVQGGFDLYNVTNPAAPVPLIQNTGDKDAGTPANPADDLPIGASYHSVFLWQAGPRAFLVASDNIELTDVDIWDITNPAAPVQVGDYDLAARFPQIRTGETANGGNVFNHDMIVKQINGRFIMSVSNWDSGYVQIDVTDPANATYVTDTTFGADAFRAPLSSEGNAHQSEFSFDNQFLLAADEDFNTRRNVTRVTTGPGAGTVPSGSSDGVQPSQVLPDGIANGTPVYVGAACNGEVLPAPPATTGNVDAIAAILRGPNAMNPASCAGGFAEKIDNAEAAGYDAVVIFNQTPRPDGDPITNMATGGATIPAVQVTRATAVGTASVNGRIFPGLAGANPAPGAVGQGFEFADFFDGWGYTRLYDAKTSALIDSYVVPEANDPRFEVGFGDLSVHEFATDPTEPIAYTAYYGAGMRTFRFSRTDGLVPTGKWIDDDGNGSNFWGVEVFTSGGERYFAGSDRDFGLQIFRFTGGSRAQRPVCNDIASPTTSGASVAFVLDCFDANGNPLAVRITDPPDNGTLSGIAATRASGPVGRVTYTPNAGFVGTDSFGYTANDGAADAAEKRVTVTVSQAPVVTPPGPGGGTYYYGIKRKPSISIKVKPKRDKKKPFRFVVSGTLKRPNGVSKANGCKGTVQITAKKGKKTVGKRRTGVKSSCKYKARIKLRKSAGKRGTVKVRAQFLGNNRLFKAKSKNVKVKYGKAKKRKKNRN